MFPINDQFPAVLKANLEATLATFAALSVRTVESVEKIAELNINVAKSSLEDSAAATKQLLTSKDPQEFFAVGASQIQPTAAKTIAYGRHLANVLTATQAEFTRATEEQFAEAGRRMSELVENVSKNAPAGSENVVALFKSAMGNANAGYEQFSKSTKQAVEAMGANLSTAVNQFAQAAEKTASASRARK
jgi:phasin family protein